MDHRAAGAAALALALALTGCKAMGVDAQDCAQSLCGCWRETTLDFEATVVGEGAGPLEGIALTCNGESSPIVNSDADGHARFEVQVNTSPGCGYDRCNSIVFSDPNGRWAEQTLTALQSDGQTVVLTPSP